MLKELREHLNVKWQIKPLRHVVIIDILSLFPGYFTGPFDESMVKRAREKGIVNIRLTNIRDFADNRRRVDDRPYGGGPGMVLMPQPVIAAVRHVKTPLSKVVYLSPQGAVLNAAKCRALAQESHLILICGHYEGIDQRILEIEKIDLVSIGDYVLTSGGAAGVVVVDSVVRLLPGALGDASSAEQDSFEQGLLDWPHYTRPEIFEGRRVPEILLSGNHQAIASWRYQQALKQTQERRPDLLKNYEKIRELGEIEHE